MTTRAVVRRTVVTCLFAVLAIALSAGPAWAHTSLKSSDPARGASLKTVPTRVSLTFGEAVTVGRSPIRIVGADGTPWAVGAVSVSGATVSAAVQAAGPAQGYTMKWTVISDDGDAISGSVAFTLAVPATPPDAVAAPATAPVATPAPVPATSAAAAPVTATTVAVSSVTGAPVPETPAAVAAAQETGGGGPPVWAWVVGAVVLALLGGGLALRGRRSPSE